MVLEKVKEPGGRVFCFEMTPLDADRSGHWFLLPEGGSWTAPHDAGSLPFDVVVLVPEGEPWVAWWVPHPEAWRLEVDVCLPPTRVPAGWRFVDLELDVFSGRNGQVTIEDRDEFDAAVSSGVITSADAEMAERAASDLARVLTAGAAPWIGRGWDLLEARAHTGPTG